MGRARQGVVWLVLAPALLAVQVGFVIAVRDAVALQRRGSEHPAEWAPDDPRRVELVAFLNRASRVIPDGDVVVFSSQGRSGGIDAELYRLAAGSMPGHDLIPETSSDWAGRATYWIAYGTEVDRPWLTAVLMDDAGQVLRFER